MRSKIFPTWLITIGAHTVTHPTLPAHDIVAQFREIVESRRKCEELVDRPVRSFAYPFGDHSSATVAAVREAGFSWACTAEAGVVGRGGDRMRLPRVYAGNWRGDEFQQRVEERYG